MVCVCVCVCRYGKKGIMIIILGNIGDEFSSVRISIVKKRTNA